MWDFIVALSKDATFEGIIIGALLSSGLWYLQYTCEQRAQKNKLDLLKSNLLTDLILEIEQNYKTFDDLLIHYCKTKDIPDASDYILCRGCLSNHFEEEFYKHFIFTDDNFRIYKSYVKFISKLDSNKWLDFIELYSHNPGLLIVNKKEIVEYLEFFNAAKKSKNFLMQSDSKFEKYIKSPLEV